LISLFALAIALQALHEVFILSSSTVATFAGKAASFGDYLTTVIPC
jgi:hypothetical protein